MRFVWIGFGLLALSLAAVCDAAGPAGGDPVVGKAIFAQCAACHTLNKGGPNNVGPNLYGVLGKKAATNRKDFAYSPALKQSGLVWDEATLDNWIKNPAVFVPKSKMEFVGLTKKDKRVNVIAYLRQSTR
jgi:cytochrome c